MTLLGRVSADIVRPAQAHFPSPSQQRGQDTGRAT
jgi:hypothetical protein